jgi:hypothetical protein
VKNGKSGLITISQAARLYGIPRTTMFKRLKAANETMPGLLVHFTTEAERIGKWFVRETKLRQLIDGED